MSPVFRHGDFRLYLLKLLAEQPRHGYELIRALEQEMEGAYTPSAGAVYPRLASLEEEGLIEHDAVEGRKIYRITDAGRAELAARRDALDEVHERLADASEIARGIREEVRSSVRELRDQLREATREFRREEPRRERSQTRKRVIQIEIGGVKIGSEDAGELKREARALQADAQALVVDVLKAAQQHGVDRERLQALREILREARARAVEVLAREAAPAREAPPANEAPPAE